MALYNTSLDDVTSCAPERPCAGNETVVGGGGGGSGMAPIVHPQMALMRFVCEVVVSLPIAVLGILANVLVLVVLSRQKKRLTTTVVLQALAVADTLILISSILLRSMRYVGWRAYDNVYRYAFVSLYPAVYFFRLADTWITVIMTVDRYIAVCYPLRAQRLCTLRRTYVIIGVIVLATFAFSTPRFFEFRLTDDDRGGSGSGFVHTTLVTSRTYTVVYRIVAFFVVMYLLPMSILVVLNFRLLHSLRRAHDVRDTMLSNGSRRDAMLSNGSRLESGADARHASSSSSSTSTASRSVTLIVVTIVVVCVVCNVVTMTSHVLWALQMCFAEMRHLESKRRFLANVSNVMVTFNSAINFVIYCMFSKTFRTAIKETSSCHRLVGMTRSWRSSCRSTTSSSANATNTLTLRSQERVPLKQTFSSSSKKSAER